VCIYCVCMHLHKHRQTLKLQQSSYDKTHTVVVTCRWRDQVQGARRSWWRETRLGPAAGKWLRSCSASLSHTRPLMCTSGVRKSNQKLYHRKNKNQGWGNQKGMFSIIHGTGRARDGHVSSPPITNVAHAFSNPSAP
jgi:hypothetical protein